MVKRMSWNGKQNKKKLSNSQSLYSINNDWNLTQNALLLLSKLNFIHFIKKNYIQTNALKVWQENSTGKDFAQAT